MGDGTDEETDEDHEHGERQHSSEELPFNWQQNDTGEADTERDPTVGEPASSPRDGSHGESQPDGETPRRRSEDRLWNRIGRDESEPATGDGGSGTGDTDSTVEPTGNEAPTPEGGTRSDGNPGQARSSTPGENSFDHLLDRTTEEPSHSGTGSRQVSGTSLETELETFLSNLTEFDKATAGSQVLVISPSGHSITDEVCAGFLASGEASEKDVMFVTSAQSPGDRLQICRNSVDWTSGEVAVVEVGDIGGTDSVETVNGDPVLTKRVTSPKNLSKIGLLITQIMKGWSNNDRPSMLCFHTLSSISGYVQNQALFQFLFTLQAKLDSYGVSAHYHMGADQHDDQELNTLKTIFDVVIRVSANGEIDVE